MAGLGEVCSHVGALLFKIEMGVKIGMTETSSTSKACQWNSTFRREVTSATVTEIFDQIKGKRIKEIRSVQADGSAPLPSSDILEDLFFIVPNAAFFTSVSVPGLTDVIPTTTPTRQRTKSASAYPVLLTSFSEISVDKEHLDDQCVEIFNKYTVSEDQSRQLEKATRNQAVSPLWYQHRMGRVTASKAHDVLTRQEKTSPDNLVKRIVGYTSYNLSKKDDVKWGIEHEDECREMYAKHQISSHINFECKLSGFVVHNKHPFLGASPDGIIYCQCCGKGTLEIKCPYKHRNRTVNEAASLDNNFFLDSMLHLKSNHRYYTQVQLQMYLTGSTYCDFVVYTKCEPAPSLVIVKVPVDLAFCEKLITKCEQFIKNHVVKELVTKHLENQPSAVKSEEDSKSSDQTWCLCSEPEYGRMIKCDNSECPYEWFHYKCVNIRRKPLGKWFCVSCEP